MKGAVVLCALFCACVKIIHSPPPDGGGSGGSGGVVTGGTGGSGTGGSGGGGPIAHVQMLWQFNLPRTAANLTPFYARFHDNLIAALTDSHIAVDETGVAGQYGPVQLIWGSSSRAQPSQNLQDTLTMAASSGMFEPPAAGSEAEQINLQQLGANLANLTIPPQLVNGDSIVLYGPPVDAFIVVTVHSTARLCALGDAGCQLAGSQPLDFFTAVRGDGTASWLQQIGGSPGIAMDHVYWVDIVTSEAESTSAFTARCSAVPGFSRTLLDVIAPSPAVYYNDFKTQGTSRGLLVQEIDMCEALGDPSVSLLRSAAGAITTRLASQH